MSNARAAVVVPLLVAAAVVAHAQTLGKYVVDMDEVTVSGLSAGAFMAIQLHVAFSSTFRGVGSIAGGAYYCAQGNLATALSACMTSPGQVNVATLQRAAESYAAEGDIEPLAGLAQSRIYVFAGTADTTVVPGESPKIEQFYAKYVNGTDPVDGRPRVITEYTIPAAHAHITDFYGNPCNRQASPYINNCGYDQAGVLLQHLYYGQLAPRDAAVPGNMLRFSQNEFGGASMDPTGFVYVPTACQGGATCKLHVALHGCLQNWADPQVGTKYIDNAGYNQWAEPNNIIILYPQAKADAFLGNPNACFDWFAYSGRDYATKTGSQMKAIYDMVMRLSAGAPVIAPPTNVHVVNTTDNSVTLAWDVPDGATAYEVERDSIRITPAGGIRTPHFTDSGLAPGTRYTYVVIALNDDDAASIKSDPVTAQTTGVPPPLSAPTDLTAEIVTASSVYLVWTTVSGADRYQLFRDGAQVANVTITNFDDTSLAPETTYAYVVRASNSYETGPSSAITHVTTGSSWQCREFFDNNYNHVADSRAYQRMGYVYAYGSDDYMGLYNVATYNTLAETSAGYFVIGSC